MFTGGAFLVTPILDGEIMTRERFSEVQVEIQRVVEEFALQRIAPNKPAIEKFDRELSMTLFKECGEMGLLSVDIPEKYGGSGLGTVTAMVVAEMITYGQCPSFALTHAAHCGIGTLPIVYFGNGPQKDKYLPKIGSGEWVSAFALTEAESGSDALSAKTTAVLTPDGGQFVLNGTKQFITNGAWADVYIVFANMAPKQMVALIVERTWPGVHPGAEEHKMGMKGSSTTRVNFDDVRVPVENVLGEPGKGHVVALDALDFGRLKLGASDLGACRAVIREALAYARERRQFGRPIAQFDAIKGKFADMIVQTFALDSMLYRTAATYESILASFDLEADVTLAGIGEALENLAIEASINKIYGSEAIWQVADQGMQIFGGYGFIEDYPLASVVRDTRVDRIYEGTNEINRQIITSFAAKKVATGDIDLRASLAALPNSRLRFDPEHLRQVVPETTPLCLEKRYVEAARLLVQFVFADALAVLGSALRNEQQVGEATADLFIALYAIDSTVRRVAQNANRDPMWDKIAQLLIAESMPRMFILARKVLLAQPDSEARRAKLHDMHNFAADFLPTYPIIALKQALADDLYAAEKYRF